MANVPFKKIHNFNSGPSILPQEVYEEAARSILDFNGSGLSILEIGHRTSLFESVMDEARQLVKDLMHLDNDHEVLFLHGGASTQFMQVPMNLLDEKGTAAYTDTGTWAGKAIKEARVFGNVSIVGSSQDKNYTYIPHPLQDPSGAAYLHLTTNETIAGTQWHQLPFQYNIPLVADMSSDILSRAMDFNRFGLIYAGAQKNMGAAGVSLVVVNKSLLGNTSRNIPSIMDYRNHIREGSMMNTPPVFAVYVVLLTLRWLKKMGGVEGVEPMNRRKAALVYDTIDTLPLFKGTVAKADRSLMNAVFVMEDPKLETAFLQECKEHGMIGVKGHRSVGGFRISMYNALPYSSVEAITNLMNDFAQRNG